MGGPVVLLASGVQISGAVAGVAGAFALLAILGAALAYTRASYAKATIETLKDNNSALSDQVKLIKEDQTTCNAKMEALTKENENLRTYVSGTEAIKELAAQLATQHTEVMAEVSTMAVQFATHVQLEHARQRRAPARAPAKAPVKAPTKTTRRTR